MKVLDRIRMYEVYLMCSFEGIILLMNVFKTMAWWLSWLERRPVTAEVVGSNPIRVVYNYIL